LVGLDIGTSGCKALVVDENGAVLAQAHAEYPLSTPQPGWSEQDPEDWWAAAQACLAQVEPFDAIGLSGQMHGSVFIDDAGQVIRPALLWNDQRTAQECALIDLVVGADRVREVTSNPPLTGFQLPKLLWLRRHEPNAYGRTRRVLLPKDFIRWRLTGKMGTEPSDASGTGCFHVRERRWATEMLQELEVDPELFPAVVESWSADAKTSEGVPVAAGGGDQAAGAVGTGAVVPGIVSVSLGTSGVVFVAQDEPIADPTGATHTFCHANGAWHRMGVMLSCGGSLRWFRDTLAPGTEYDALAAEAGSTAPGADGLRFRPYLAGERCPHNDPTLRGSFDGLSLSHRRGHLARAVFEGVTFGIVDCLRAVLPAERLPGIDGGGPSETVLRVTGGGAKGRFWLQMLADATGLTCATLEADEGPAYGAALLAGVGVGVWPSVASACAATIRERGRVEPGEASYAEAYARFVG